MASFNFHAFSRYWHSQWFVSFVLITQYDIHTFVATTRPPRRKLSTLTNSSSKHPAVRSVQVTQFASYICQWYLSPFYFQQSLRLRKGRRIVVGDSQCEAMVGKTHLLESTAHEVPLPLFGLGYDRACTFRGAPLPRSGASMSSRVHIREVSPP